MKTYLLFAGLLFMVGAAKAQTPKADFDFVVNYKCKWATVNVVNKSVDADSCFWDLRDDHIYRYSDQSTIVLGNFYGDKDIRGTLIARRNGMSDTITKVFELRQTKLRFIYTLSDTLRYAPLTVNFINTSQVFNGDSLTYVWAFGDGDTSHLANPSHTYTKPRLYYPRLEATTKSGCGLYYGVELIVKDTLQKGEFDFITSECNHGLAPSYDSDNDSDYDYDPQCDVRFDYKNDTLRIFGTYVADCCKQSTATYKNKGDTIIVQTFEVGPDCDCICEYDFSIKVPDVHRESVVVLFGWLRYNVNLLTSTVSIQDDPMFSISPNPIEKEFILSCEKLTNKSSLAIVDLSGKVVYKAKSIYDKMLINCSHLKSGIYLLKVTIDNSSTRQQKIVINNAR